MYSLAMHDNGSMKHKIQTSGSTLAWQLSKAYRQNAHLHFGRVVTTHSFKYECVGGHEHGS